MTTTKLKQSAIQPIDKIVREIEDLEAINQHKQIEDFTDKVICPYCNGYVSDIDTFCIHCGREFHEQTVSFCIRCGRRMNQNVKVCPYCGTRYNR